MNTRNATMLVVGAAAFLAVGAAAASGQDTTKTRTRRTTTTTKKAAPAASETRIPVTKEAPGEVVPPRVDTVTVYRTDTLTVAGPMRVDTLRTTVTPTTLHESRRCLRI
jgi:Rieske Fe-S protein